jgi:hypothetical protein
MMDRHIAALFRKHEAKKYCKGCRFFFALYVICSKRDLHLENFITIKEAQKKI